VSDYIDFTKASEFLFAHLLAPHCRIVLRQEQYEVLKAYLAHIERLGDGINFRLEMCVDHRYSPDHAGCSVWWDNDGDRLQDEIVDTLMEQMTQRLGFDADIIARPDYLISLDEIDDHVVEVIERVKARHDVSS